MNEVDEISRECSRYEIVALFKYLIQIVTQLERKEKSYLLPSQCLLCSLPTISGEFRRFELLINPSCLFGVL